MNVKAEHLPDGRIRLLHDFGEVPRGFICDGASIPRFFWRLLGHPYDRKHIRAGVRHDWGYTVGGDYNFRQACDERYREDLKADGVCFVARWAEYLILRFFGARHFNYRIPPPPNPNQSQSMKI